MHLIMVVLRGAVRSTIVAATTPGLHVRHGSTRSEPRMLRGTVRMMPTSLSLR
jgi:hypothetical protein